MNKKISAMYFSGTGTTEKIVKGIANKIAANAGGATTVNVVDFTLPAARKQAVSFAEDDLVIFGIPVIAGRVPNVLLKYLNTINGNGALAVAVVLYGNRNYDDALIELRDILKTDGFKVIAGGAFIGEHSFSRILAKERPDEKDMAIAYDFAQSIYDKLTAGGDIQTVAVNGCTPYRDYYKPKDRAGNPVDFRKITPKVNSNCTDCKICVDVCPMGSIDAEDVSKLNGPCIKCCACIKKCPVEAIYFDDDNFIKHKTELEVDLAERREPELFL